MLFFAAGMFTLHSVLSAFLNHLETTRKGLINGLYVSAYYSGGAVGSWLPGHLLQASGWTAFVGLLTALLLGVLLLGILLRHSEIQATEPNAD
jgi:YNFM family putative membrane transporter